MSEEEEQTVADFYKFGRAEFTLSIKDVEKLGVNGQNSEYYGTGDIDWHLNVCATEPKNGGGKMLSTFLFCSPVDVANAWKICGQFRIVLENRNDLKQSLARQMDFSFESEVAENRGWNSFISLEEALKESNGFIKDGEVTFHVIVGVQSIVGFDSPKYFNFLEKGDYSDGTITVDEQTFYVNKMILSVHSPVISEKFAKDSDITIDGVDRFEFNDFLQLLYSVPLRIEKNNVGTILKMSTKFDTYGLRMSCEQYLKYATATKQVTSEWAIEMADTHNLKVLLSTTLNSITSTDDLKEKFKNFKNLSNDTLKEVVKKSLSFV